MEDEFSHHEGWDDDTLQDALVRFEEVVKRRFTGREETIWVPVPGLVDDREKGILRGKLTIPADKIKFLFEPVMSMITALVKTQVNLTNTPKAIILVGGFGRSPYLRDCIKQVIDPGIEVM